LASQTSVSIEFAPDCSWIVQFLSLWTPCLVIFTSVCSKCGIINSGKLIGNLCTFYPWQHYITIKRIRCFF
ncbi:hypothetical protein T03_13797, partial [Trichinella britovi]